jgi:hypothetical protein
MAGSDLDQKREALFAAAADFIFKGKAEEQQRGLCAAASAYHEARMAAHRPAPKQQTNGNGAKYKVPFGRTKGTPISEAETKDLNYIVGRLKEGLDDPNNSRWREKNSELLAAIEAELETR